MHSTAHTKNIVANVLLEYLFGASEEVLSFPLC